MYTMTESITGEDTGPDSEVLPPPLFIGRDEPAQIEPPIPGPATDLDWVPGDES